MALQTATIIGSGPNGLAAAITLAQRGVAVTVYERNARLGGACSTGEVTLPGFHHDLGSSVYPLGVCSPFFTSLPLAEHGLRWIEPEAPLAHPLDDGSALTLEHSLEWTAEQLGSHDARAWRTLLASTVRDWPKVVEDAMRPLLGVPRHPAALATFGAAAMMPAQVLARSVFQGERARTLFAGCAAHSVLPLTKVASSAPGLLLAGAAHATGWPIADGGAQSLTAALASYLKSLGGSILCDAEVNDLSQIEDSDVTLFDTSVEAMARIAGDSLSPSYVARLRSFRRGPGIFKLDWALSEPTPWANAECARAATVHLGGSLEEIAASEAAMFYGKSCEKPFVLLVQPSLFDASRAPEDKHTAWAYCHVPNGSDVDMTAAVEAQVERFAPGFGDVVLARRASNAAALEAWNPNLVGGDVSGGAMTLSGLMARPTMRLYRTSNAKLYLCSSSTPPGGGVHGMCGYWAALAALEDFTP